MRVLRRAGGGMRFAGSGMWEAGSDAAAFRRVARVLISSAVIAAFGLPLTASRAPLPAQAPAADTMTFYKALDLEAAGKYREAAPLFRSALQTSAVVNALLGLERVYAELG